MRKLGAVSLAAFYLLLTTGMFVCLVHCSAEYFFAGSGQQLSLHDDDGDDDHVTPATHDEHHQGKEHDHKKSCGEGKDCSCCNQHGNYTINENISGSLTFQLTSLQVAINPIPYQELAPTPSVYLQKISWLNATGPPVISNNPLYISYRSLLI